MIITLICGVKVRRYHLNSLNHCEACHLSKTTKQFPETQVQVKEIPKYLEPRVSSSSYASQEVELLTCRF